MEKTDLRIEGIENRVRSFAPDVVLVSLPDGGDSYAGFVQSTCSIADRRPVIVLAPGPPRRGDSGLLAPGIAGYILTAAGLEEVVKAVTAVLIGGLGVGGMGKALERFQPADRSRCFPALSDRQAVILRLMADGLNYKEIAERLYVSQSVVKKDVRKMLQAVGVQNHVGLLAYALRAGVVGGGGRGSEVVGER